MPTTGQRTRSAYRLRAWLLVSAILIVAGVVGVASCGANHHLEPTENGEFLAALREVQSAGTNLSTVPLRDMVDVAFDEVYRFGEADSGEDVNEEVGADLFDPGAIGSLGHIRTILVFKDHGDVVAAVLLPTLRISGERGPWPGSVKVQRFSSTGAPIFNLRLAE